MRTNARIIAATNQNLEERVADGKFREDLFYRLNVFPVLLAPLREQYGYTLLIAELAHRAEEDRGSLRLTSADTGVEPLPMAWQRPRIGELVRAAVGLVSQHRCGCGPAQQVPRSDGRRGASGQDPKCGAVRNTTPAGCDST